MKKKYTRWSDCDSDLKRRIVNTNIKHITENTEFNTYINNKLFGSKVITVGSDGEFTTLREAASYIINYTSQHEGAEWVICLLPQTHTISDRIYFPPINIPLTILGFAAKDTILKNVSESAITMLDKGSGDILISNVTFLGDASYNDVGFEDTTGLASGANDIYINQCTFDNVGTGIRTQSLMGTKMRVTNCQFFYPTEYGILRRNNTYESSVIADCSFVHDGTGSVCAIDIWGSLVRGSNINIYGFETGVQTQSGAILNGVRVRATTTAYKNDDNGSSNPLLLCGCMADGCTTDIETTTVSGYVYISGGMYDSSKITKFAGSVIAGYYVDHITDTPVIYPKTSADEQVKISSDDTDSGYLNGKIVAGSNITLTENNPGGDETLTIAVSSAAEDDKKFKVSSDDTTPGFAEDKLTAGDFITLTTTSPAGDEKREIDLSFDNSTVGDVGGGSLGVLDTGVDTAQLADDSVTRDKIDSGVAGNGLDQAVDGSLEVKVDDTTITVDTDTVKIADGGVDTTQLADDSVDVSKLAHNIDATGIGFDADKVDGQDASDFAADEHAPQHASGGGDSIKLDDLDTPDDNTDLNVTTSYHGLCPKLDNDSDHYLDGEGNWTTPAGGDDEKVKVSSNDTDAGYLEGKIASEGTIDITEVNDGGDEDLSLDVNYDGTTIGKNGSSELEVKDDGIVAAKIGSDVDYSVISGNDAATDISGAELEELTDGSDTSLHTHSGLTPGSHGSSHTDGTDDISVDDSTIEINGSDQLAVKDGGIDTSQLANDSVDKDKINSDVAGDMLAQNGDGSLEVDDDDASVASNALNELEIKGFRAADNERILVKTGDAISYATLSQVYGDDNVFVVGPSGYGDYTTIAAGLSAASSASPTSSNRMVVMVLPDVYQITSAIAGVQYVDIIGTSRDSCIIDNNSGTALDTFNPASDSTIANFRLLGNYAGALTPYDNAFDITGTISNLVIHDIYLEDYRWGITGNGGTWTNFNIYNIHIDDCFGAIGCTSLTDSDVRFRNIDIVESTGGRATYGVWNNGSDKWSMWNVRLKGGMSNGFQCSSAGAELRLYGCEVDGADIGYLADGGASIIRANGCSALNCGTNDCKTNNTSAKIYLSGGEYDESTFSDVGTGTPGSKGITGGFFNLNTDSWDDARTP